MIEAQNSPFSLFKATNSPDLDDVHIDASSALSWMESLVGAGQIILVTLSSNPIPLKR